MPTIIFVTTKTFRVLTASDRSKKETGNRCVNAMGVSKLEFIFSFTTNKHVYLITDLDIYSVNKY